MKKNKSIIPEPNGSPTITEKETAPPPRMSNAELKKLFITYDAANDKVGKAKADLEKALSARSIIVEQIAEGGGRGPFGYKGLVLTVVCRESKSTGEKTWFFKGPSKNDLVEI